MKRLLVAGVAMRGDGYPNAVNTVRLLRRNGQWDVRDHADWLPDETRLWQLVRGRLLPRLSLMLRLGAGGFVQAVGLCATFKRGDVAYLPYPAPLTLWWLSMIPARWRPYCMADAYVSLWDSMFRDRGNGNSKGVLSRVVRFFEGRALRAADLVLVDTEANKRQMISDFSLSPGQVRSLPLAIDEQLFLGPPVAARTGALRVLFVGTLVPLHGVEVVLAASDKLASIEGIEILLVGDGQQGGLVEDFISKGAPANFRWVREWRSMSSIAREIEAADICLGVFGGAGKASRVLPFKLYYALAAGKAVVTQADYALPADRPPLPAIFLTSAGNDDAAEELVRVIMALAADADARSTLGAEARIYFERQLSAEVIEREWRDILDRVGE
ncbi:glycosyltransferase [Pseudoxanthomonas sp. Root65]|uniref:glycosyltransferase n=1 Tax=Pseudoxanthomonas sp. Root65 TaxID=1736576 RepID=UPI0012E3885B|nr:glycosyltransferase [Pseudoxanthomonas sp. Root65]